MGHHDRIFRDRQSALEYRRQLRRDVGPARMIKGTDEDGDRWIVYLDVPSTPESQARALEALAAKYPRDGGAPAGSPEKPRYRRHDRPGRSWRRAP